MDSQNIDTTKLNDTLAWAKSLVGEKIFPEDKFPRMIQLFDEYNREKNLGGGCRGCRLKRLNRRYRDVLSKV